VFELFLPLAWGGSVILADNLFRLPDLPAAGEVTLLNTVPSLLVELLRARELPPSIQTVNLAGEPLSTSLVNRVYQSPSVQEVYNLYGPSEDTTYSTCALVPRNSTNAPTIGRPIANKKAYILGPGMQPLPIGVPGELFLGGVGLARGYHNRAELTEHSFVTNPFDSMPVRDFIAPATLHSGCQTVK